MNLSQLFGHWKIRDNPFRGEEARHDDVFVRMGSSAGSLLTSHTDFEKILGQLPRTSTSIVFGEKGSGKTAIRMQLANCANQHNAQHPDDRVLMVAYDDLNASLDHLHAHFGNKNATSSLKKIRLVDHLDAILARATTQVVDLVLDQGDIAKDSERAERGAAQCRKLDREARRDLVLLQTVYDQSARSAERAGMLRRRLRLMPASRFFAWNMLAMTGWLPLVVVLVLYAKIAAPDFGWEIPGPWSIAMISALIYWALMIAKRFVWDRLMVARLTRRIARQTRFVARSERGLRWSLDRLAAGDRTADVLPMSDSDEQRYALYARLMRVLGQLGYQGVMVVMDRVDEPTLVNGDTERMRAIVWPMLNNKFLQLEGLGIKMLLPIELRHVLYKESSSFFQEARLDKQSLIDRLGWSGAMLYDLCDARLQACREEGAGPLSLLDLFEEDVSRQDLVDALDQMHQPRDAFKFLYHCLNEHCSNVTREQESWRVPRLVLDSVKKQEADRVQQLYRGIRPA